MSRLKRDIISYAYSLYLKLSWRWLSPPSITVLEKIFCVQRKKNMCMFAIVQMHINWIYFLEAKCCDIWKNIKSNTIKTNFYCVSTHKVLKDASGLENNYFISDQSINQSHCRKPRNRRLEVQGRSRRIKILMVIYVTESLFCVYVFSWCLSI